MEELLTFPTKSVKEAKIRGVCICARTHAATLGVDPHEPCTFVFQTGSLAGLGLDSGLA